MEIHNLILRPVITEKSAQLNAQRKYTIVVKKDTTKIDITRAIESIYATKVDSVRIMNTAPKTRTIGRGREITKRKEEKRAIVTLKQGEKPIDFIKTSKKKK